MKTPKHLLVIGGDKRQLYMAQALETHCYEVTVYGFGKQDGFEGLQHTSSPLRDALHAADAVILPLPTSRDGTTIHSPYTHSPAKLQTVLETLHGEQTVFAGMMQQEWKSAFFQKGIPVYDYFEREELAVRNAIPTAQGVLQTLFTHIAFTLHGAGCAITGYGKVARVLANTLRALGTKVTIFARRPSDLAWAAADGHTGLLLADFCKTAQAYDILINTVPAQILAEKQLRCLRADCLVLEIASAPYGIDFSAAQNLGLKVIVAGSLPGKVAPKTAGEIICDAVHNIIKEGSQCTQLP